MRPAEVVRRTRFPWRQAANPASDVAVGGTGVVLSGRVAVAVAMDTAVGGGVTVGVSVSIGIGVAVAVAEGVGVTMAASAGVGVGRGGRDWHTGDSDP